MRITRTQHKRTQRRRPGRRLLLAGLAGIFGISGSVGLIGGVLGSAFAPTVAGATVCTNTGVGIAIGDTVLEGPTYGTVAPFTTTARSGDKISYRVIVTVPLNVCKLTTGVVKITLPNGTINTLTNNLTLTPGQTKTYNETETTGKYAATLDYIVTTTDIGTNGAKPGNIRATDSVVGKQTKNGRESTSTAATNDPISVLHPETTLTKSATPTSGTVPLQVTYTFTESNVSTLVDPTTATATFFSLDTITTVAVTDFATTSGTPFTACVPTFTHSSTSAYTPTTGVGGELAPGVTWTYTCTVTFTTVMSSPTPASFVDYATASGFAGDGRLAGTPTSFGASATEMSTIVTVNVGKAHPVLTTTATPKTTTLGPTLEIHDTATVTGGFNPSGTVTFTLYKTSCTAGTIVFTSSPVPYTGSTPVSSGTVLISTAGTYYWAASATVTANNASTTLTSPCTTSNATETTVVQKHPSKIHTTPTPTSGTTGVTLKDRITLSTLVNPVTGATAGTITVHLYGPANATCSGTGTHTWTIVASTGTSVVYVTTPGFVANTAGVWHWTATYSGDSNNTTATSGCATEPVTVKAPPTGKSLTPGYWKNHLSFTRRHPTTPYTKEFLPQYLGNCEVKNTKHVASTHSTCAGAFTVLSNLTCKTTGINCLAGQLLATELNVAAFGPATSTITGIITAANQLLKTAGYSGPKGYPKTWAATAKALAAELSTYNQKFDF